MTLPFSQLSPEVCVAGQLTPESMAEAARAGFRSVINNRPDFEGGPDQPTSAQIEAAARSVGLEYRFLPVAPNHQTAQEVTAFAALLAELPQPVLAFCRTGTRSTRLFNAGARRG
jgi:uncharacterized protein (TIGR01244 family)